MTVWLFSIGKDMLSEFGVSLHSQNNQGTIGNGTTQPVIKLPRGKKHGTWNPATANSHRCCPGHQTTDTAREDMLAASRSQGRHTELNHHEKRNILHGRSHGE